MKPHYLIVDMTDEINPKTEYPTPRQKGILNALDAVHLTMRMNSDRKDVMGPVVVAMAELHAALRATLQDGQELFICESFLTVTQNEEEK